MNTDWVRASGKKILYVTLCQLQQIMNTKYSQMPVFKNTRFEYLVFVARLTKNGEKCIFSDQTQILQYQSKKIRKGLKLKIGSYYECFCIMKMMDESFQPLVLNIAEVEGNLITTHMIRAIKQTISSQINERERIKYKQNEDRIEQQNQPLQMYNKMKSWMNTKIQFTEQQLKLQFENKANSSLFLQTLSKLEDEAIIGNMGDRYQYFG